MNETRRVDRRVRKTRRALSDACIKLVLEKGYEAVTVEEIAERADVGRATFYIHFRDKEDLFASSTSRISEELYESIAPLVFSDAGFIVTAPLQLIFQHAKENAALYRTILNGSGNGSALKRLRQDLTRYARRAFEAEATQLGLSPSVPTEVIAQHFVGALLGLVRWWLEEGLPYSVDQMCDMLSSLSLHGRNHVMGRTPPVT